MSEQKLEHRLTKVEEGLDFVKVQVTNHIPTSIRELKETIETHSKKTDKQWETLIEKSEARYSKKWVESFVMWLIRIVIGGIIGAGLALVLSHS